MCMLDVKFYMNLEIVEFMKMKWKSLLPDANLGMIGVLTKIIWDKLMTLCIVIINCIVNILGSIKVVSNFLNIEWKLGCHRVVKV